MKLMPETNCSCLRHQVLLPYRAYEIDEWEQGCSIDSSLIHSAMLEACAMNNVESPLAHSTGAFERLNAVLSTR